MSLYEKYSDRAVRVMVPAPFDLTGPELEILIEKMCGDFDMGTDVTRLLTRLVRFRITIEDAEHRARVAEHAAQGQCTLPGVADPTLPGVQLGIRPGERCAT